MHCSSGTVYVPFRIGMNDCREHSGTNKPEGISTDCIETVDGTWIEIEREADIFIYDRMKTTSVLDPEGTQFIFEPEQISAIEAR